jgi:hypothetical protein
MLVSECHHEGFASHLACVVYETCNTILQVSTYDRKSQRLAKTLNHSASYYYASIVECLLAPLLPRKITCYSRSYASRGSIVEGDMVAQSDCVA